MSWELRDKLSRLTASLARMLRRQSRRRVRRAPTAIRGNMRRVLVVSPPGEQFAEAIFVLKDDYFQTPGVSRQELFKQAKIAAEDYLDTALPKGSSTSLFPSAASVFLLGAACSVMALWLSGLLG